MTPAFRQGFMHKLAEISSPEDLDALYAKLKYRILNQKTNHPYFNTNRKTFANWHLLSPEQIKKHKIGICWDTAAMTDKVLSDLGVEHANYFAHSKDLSKATHSFNVYKDKDGNWRWIEGAWKPYKGNDWKERRKKDLVKRIVRALEEAGGDKQIIHSVDKFPEPGVGDKEFYEEMLKHPVKRAELEKAAALSWKPWNWGKDSAETGNEYDWSDLWKGIGGGAATTGNQVAHSFANAGVNIGRVGHGLAATVQNNLNPFGGHMNYHADWADDLQKDMDDYYDSGDYGQQAKQLRADSAAFRRGAKATEIGAELLATAPVFGAAAKAGTAGVPGLMGAIGYSQSRARGNDVGRSLAWGAGSAGLAAGLQAAAPWIARGIGAGARGVGSLGRKAVAHVKNLSPALRRFALKLNAHDPYHRKLMTRLLNVDLPKYPRTRQGDMFLTHSTVSGASGGRGFDTARQFVQEGKYMPSMGLAPENGVTWYGSGVNDPSAVSGAPVRFFFDEPVLKMPRTAIYPVSDAATPIYSDMVAAVGSDKLADKAVREALYDGFYRTGGLRGTRTTISPRQASYRNGVEVDKGNFGKVFEVKPYHDIPADAPKAVSIGHDRAGNFGDPALQRELGERGIPYYFVDETPIPGQFMDFRSAKAPPSDGFILDPREMAREFAPKIRP